MDNVLNLFLLMGDAIANGRLQICLHIYFDIQSNQNALSVFPTQRHTN